MKTKRILNYMSTYGLSYLEAKKRIEDENKEYEEYEAFMWDRSFNDFCDENPID